MRAARTQSFKRAAAELHVSASALSRQIQALERHLGVRLFQRLNPGLALTDEGRRYLEPAAAALAQLEAAQALFAPQRRALRISALESFSECWLVPNLPDFERAHPDVEIELEATLRYADFERERVDAAIRVTYDHVNLALSAAESGQGVALSAPILCAARLRAKRLRRLFRTSVRSAETYHFVCRPESLEDPLIAALRDWLVLRLAEADAPRASARAK